MRPRIQALFQIGVEPRVASGIGSLIAQRHVLRLPVHRLLLDGRLGQVELRQRAQPLTAGRVDLYKPLHLLFQRQFAPSSVGIKPHA